MNTTVVDAQNLARHYEVSRGSFKKPVVLKALDGASFTLDIGKTLAVVGESGCGKSTLARLVTMIEPPTAGDLVIDGIDVVRAGADERRKLRAKVQIVFQNPYGSLNPRQKIGSTLEEPLKINTDMAAPARRAAAAAMLDQVGLRPEHYQRYPHMFSGGQRQRIAIARALMLNPSILVLDEPVSALDVSIQAQVLNILADLQDKMHLSYLFISHDLAVVKHVADDIMVMYLGRPVETGSAAAILETPKHPYTKALLSATPIADPAHRKERIRLEGELPSPIDPPSGCPFHPRCRYAETRCRIEVPAERASGEQNVACHGVEEGRI